MHDYNFWADMLTTFRSSSNMVKIVWITSVTFAPAITVLSFAYTALKLRRLKLPESHMFTFNTLEYGQVDIYCTKKNPASRQRGQVS